MKKNDLLILISLVSYVILFYHQFAGLNFLLFTILIIVLVVFKDQTLLKNKSWIATATGSLLSGICVFIYGNALSIISNILSLAVMGSYSFQRSSSLIFAGFHSSFTFVSALPYMAFRISDQSNTTVKNKNLGIKFLMIVLPILISLVFLMIYRSANPVFKNYTDQLRLDFISWEWIRFVIGGWILLYAFFNQVDIPFLIQKDHEGSDNLIVGEYSSSIALPRTNYENTTGIILFTMLNILLLLLNIIDVNTLWISSSLPEGISHSELVHQSIGLLITSIIIAISIILYFFRGSLNFYPSNNTIKILTYLWIIQNALLVITTIYKNQLYIEAYSLTYKRIGVYIYLLLTLIGLITTFIKVYLVKSNWYLFRKNGWIFYSILILSCFLNWDLIITRYNIKHSKDLDNYYLLELAPTSLPGLMDLVKSKSDEDPLKYRVYSNTKAFLDEQQNKTLPSLTIEAERVKRELSDYPLPKHINIPSFGADSAAVYPADSIVVPQ